MYMTSFKPYSNESDSISIGSLTVENRLDRIDLYGSLSLTLDLEGLAHARKLKVLIDATLETLAAAKANGVLPEHIKIAKTDTIPNPFG
jgi:hypothetical protein